MEGSGSYFLNILAVLGTFLLSLERDDLERYRNDLGEVPSRRFVYLERWL